MKLLSKLFFFIRGTASLQSIGREHVQLLVSSVYDCRNKAIRILADLCDLTTKFSIDCDSYTFLICHITVDQSVSFSNVMGLLALPSSLLDTHHVHLASH